MLPWLNLFIQILHFLQQLNWISVFQNNECSCRKGYAGMYCELCDIGYIKEHGVCVSQVTVFRIFKNSRLEEFYQFSSFIKSFQVLTLSNTWFLSEYCILRSPKPRCPSPPLPITPSPGLWCWFASEQPRPSLHWSEWWPSSSKNGNPNPAESRLCRAMETGELTSKIFWKYDLMWRFN